MITLTQQTSDGAATYTLQVTLPADAPQIFEYAAKADGWRPQVHNNEGQLVNNPETTLSRVVSNMIRAIFAAATQQKAIEDADTARMQTISTMQATQQAWLSSLQ